MTRKDASAQTGDLRDGILATEEFYKNHIANQLYWIKVALFTLLAVVAVVLFRLYPQVSAVFLPASSTVSIAT